MADEIRIGDTVFTMPSDREVVATRLVRAPRALVWDAHTSPRHLPHWLLGPEGWTMPLCEVDVRPGGRWRFGWRGPAGEEMTMDGVYREVLPPERLVYTERWGADWPEAVNTLLLTEQAGATMLTAAVAYASAEVRDRALATGMLDGWAHSYDRLDGYLQTLQQPAGLAGAA